MAISTTPTNKIAGGSFLIETRQAEEIFTPEDFTDQHKLIAQTAEEFAVNEIVPATIAATRRSIPLMSLPLVYASRFCGHSCYAGKR